MAKVLNKPSLVVTSPDFLNNEMIPAAYTCIGADINPQIRVSGIPDNTKSLAIIVDDPDAPNGTFDHWVMWNIPVMNRIEKNTAPGIQGKNGKGQNKYMGPCPPTGTHRYNFNVYALDRTLDLPAGSAKNELLQAMDNHILASGELTGLFNKTI